MRLFAALIACSLALPLAADPAAWSREFPKTDFSQSSIAEWSEIRSGGPPRDGIPALSSPDFVPASQDAKLDEREPVITLDMDGAPARAYPIRYLLWHEIVNDSVSGIPVAVTYCPLCNSALSFDRRTAAGVLEFGVTGKLRHSDMVMYDRQTESWWQQARGEAIVGSLTGTELTLLPSWMESWSAFRQAHPDGLVMAEPSFRRAYGQNPYRGYDTSRQPFLYTGENPPHGIDPLARVVRVGERAWPLTRLRESGQLDEAGLSLTWQSGQASPLDTREIAKGRDVGNIRVQDGQGHDVPHDLLFAFAFHAFWPDGTWMLGQ
ncbi:DUF3179 domain-containing protein [Lutimaribacter marinistellae]|uniref:DUF3179 domain-containing protein n=1 Tax=Lutimaribacter marinistellae TaxID=1820329 RepID=A0ABV7TH70_9RHOB